MDAFDLLPSLADGELAQTGAPDLVAAIVRSRASGTLSIETGDGTEIRQYFRMGNMCGSAFFAGFRTLAQVLLANDWVNALDIDASLAEAQATGKRHGQVLVEKRLLTADQLKSALGAQHKQNLGSLLALDRGHYELRGWEPPPAWSKELQIDPVEPLLEAFANERARGRRHRVLDWLGNSSARLSVDWPELSQRVVLEAADRRAVALLALPRKQDEFFRLAHLEQARAEALLVTMLLVGGAEPHPLAASSPPPPQPSVPPPGPAYVPPYPARSRPPPSVPPTPPGNFPPGYAPPFSPAPYTPPGTPFAPKYASPPSGVAPVAPPSRPPPPAESIDLQPLEPEQARPSQGNSSLGPPLVSAASRAARSSPPPRQGTNPGYQLQQPMPARPSTNSGYRLPSAPAPSIPPQPPPEPEPLPPEAGLTTGELVSLLSDPPAEQPAFDAGEAGPHAAVVLQHRPEATLELDDRPQIATQGFEYHAGRSGTAPSIPPPSTQDTASSDERRKRMRATGLRNLMGQTGESRPAEPVSGPIFEDTRSATMDESLLSAEDRRFVEEVRLRAGQVQQQDAYQRLGVARTVGSDGIRTAYLDAAKRFHPDRAAAPGLEGIARDLQTVFSAMKDAYDLISTAQARTQYDAQLKAGGTAGKQSKKDEGAMALKMGEVLLKKRDFAAALAKLKRSVELDSNGDSMAALAWAMMCDPATSPAGKEEAASLINKALRASGISARTYYVAGVMWRTKDPDSAADAFRKALELEPNHADASLELRLLEMRQGRTKQGGGVLSGLLFGKRK